MSAASDWDEYNRADDRTRRTLRGRNVLPGDVIYECRTYGRQKWTVTRLDPPTNGICFGDAVESEERAEDFALLADEFVTLVRPIKAKESA